MSCCIGHKFLVNLPFGEVGDCKIIPIKYPHRDANFDYLFAGCEYPERFTALMKGDEELMSDIPLEMHEHMWLYNNAKGNVLINGLGLGMCLKAILTKPEVTHVDVVEINQDVIDLIAPHYRKGARVGIFHDDANTINWGKHGVYGMTWDVVWHDHFYCLPANCGGEMKAIWKKYENRCGKQKIFSVNDNVMKEILEGHFDA